MMKSANEGMIAEESPAVPEQQPPRGDEDYSWMQNGTKIMVKMGKEELPFAAWVMSEPSFEDGRSWMVKVKWEGWTRTKNGVYDEVECSRCEKIDISGGSHRRRLQPRRSAKMPEADAGEPQSAQQITSRKRDRDKSSTEEELLTTAAAAAATVAPELDDSEDDCKPAAQTMIKFKSNKKRYEDAKQSLCAMPGLNEQEVVEALGKVGPPYGLQTVMQTIEEARTKTNEWTEPQGGPFVPTVGMRIRKVSGGKVFYGTVTGDAERCRVDANDDCSELVQMWEVTFDDGNLVDDMDWHELFQCRVDRPRKPAPCRGRQLQFLELFSGKSPPPSVVLLQVLKQDNKILTANLPFSYWKQPQVKVLYHMSFVTGNGE